jgi:hypothetical protein
VRFGDADDAVAAVAGFDAGEKRAHAGDVALKREVHQIVGDCHVLVE